MILREVEKNADPHKVDIKETIRSGCRENARRRAEEILFDIARAESSGADDDIRRAYLPALEEPYLFERVADPDSFWKRAAGTCRDVGRLESLHAALAAPELRFAKITLAVPIPAAAGAVARRLCGLAGAKDPKKAALYATWAARAELSRPGRYAEAKALVRLAFTFLGDPGECDDDLPIRCAALDALEVALYDEYGNDVPYPETARLARENAIVSALRKGAGPARPAPVRTPTR